MNHYLPLTTLITLLLATLLSACAGAASASAPSLNGSEWQLTELNGKKLPVHVRITLVFKDGKAGGTAACNGYGADYKQDGAKLSLGQAVSTLMFCEGMMDYERDYLAAFGKVKSFKLENDVLSLLDEKSAVLLVFGKPQPAPALEGTSWKAIQAGSLAGPARINVSMSFAGGRISGKAACNNYFAGFTQQGSQLNFSAIGATKMNCNEQGVMELEQTFLNSLSKVRSFEIQRGTLVLKDADGGELIYLKP